MTAGHDNRDGYDDRGGYDGYDDRGGYGGSDDRDGGEKLDALLAVFAEEPLPDEARADAAFMAEHRAAVADVALLREQLGIIGDTLAGPAPSPRPAPEPAASRERWYRHPGVRTLSFGALVTAAVASAVLGIGWLAASNNGADVNSGGSASDKSAASGGSAQGATHLACARLLVEGDITRVEPVRGTGEDRVTLRVTRSYVPAKGGKEVTFRVERAVVPGSRPGQHVLAGIRKGATNPDLWITDAAGLARERAAIAEALPASSAAACD